MWLTLIILGGLTIFLFFYLRKKHSDREARSFFSKLGILQVDASSAASSLDLFLFRKDVSARDTWAYRLLRHKREKYCGLVELSEKVILLRDLELIKKVLIKDFDHFADRRSFADWSQENNPLRKMLFNMNGPEWRQLRNTLTPAFASGKIRKMVPCFNEIGLEWVNSLKSKAKSKPELRIEVVESTNQFAIDAIAASVFALRLNTVHNPDSEFASMAKRFLEPGFVQALVAVLVFTVPALVKSFGWNPIDMEAMEWLGAQLIEAVEERKRQGDPGRKNDFLQLLIDAQNGELELEPEGVESAKNKAEGLKKVPISNHVLKAQALSFFLEGFSNVSHLVSMTMYSLACYPEVQGKLRKEVEKVMEGNEGRIEYEMLGELLYMDMVLCEVMRTFIPLRRLERKCVRDYQDPETGLRIPKGSLVVIPADAIHHDPDYYPKPYDFNPEAHFGPEAKAGRNPMTYLPFGAGQRNCIGMRFSLLKAKVALVQLVHNFEIRTTENTPLPMECSVQFAVMTPPPGLELKLFPVEVQ